MVFAPYLYRGVVTSFQLLPGVQTTLPRLDTAAGFINHNAPAPLRHRTEQVRTSGGAAVHFWKKEWDGLTKNGGSGTMRVNEGGFGLVPYLFRGIVTAHPRSHYHLGLHLTCIEGLLLPPAGDLCLSSLLVLYLCRGIVTSLVIVIFDRDTLHLTYVKGLLLLLFNFFYNNISYTLPVRGLKTAPPKREGAVKLFLRSSLNYSRSLAIFLLGADNAKQNRRPADNKREHNDLGASPILRGACHEVHSPDQTA